MLTTNRLLPIMRSDLVVRLLTRLLLGGVEESQRELAAALHVSEPSLSAASRYVLDTGVVRATQKGRARYLSANTDSPLHEPLSQLLLVTTGPSVALSQALAVVPGVEDAYIFGSWAARANGVPGPPPGDIDVLVLGNATVTDVAEACLRVSSTVGRPVNPIIKSSSRWKDPDAFVESLQQGPLTRLDLDTPEGDRDAADSSEEPRPGPGADPDWTAGFGLV